MTDDVISLALFAYKKGSGMGSRDAPRATARAAARRSTGAASSRARRRRGPLGHRRHDGRVDAFPSSSPPTVQPQIVALAQALIRLSTSRARCTGDGLGDGAAPAPAFPRRALRIQVFDVWRPQHGGDAAARNAQSHRRRARGPAGAAGA